MQISAFPYVLMSLPCLHPFHETRTRSVG
jgi:hypothetical protein